MANGFEASRLYFWRLLPIGVLTVFVGAFTYMIAFDAVEGGLSAKSLISYVVYGVPVSTIASIVLLLPLTLVWNICFLATQRLLPVLQHRATVASGVSALFGVSTFIVFFATMVGDIVRLSIVLLPASMLPAFLAMVLTWRSFAKDGMTL